MDAEQILREDAQLVQRRSNFDGDFRSIERLLSLIGPHFQARQEQPGARHTQQQFDITATMAAQRFGAAMESLVAPSTQRYHGVMPLEPSLRKKSRIRAWCEKATDVLFARRYRWRSAFQPNIYTWFASVGCYGNAALWVGRGANRANVYQPAHLSEMYWETDDAGMVNVVHRRRHPTLHQLAMKYGEDALPEKHRATYRQSPYTSIEIIQCVRPRTDYDPDRLDAMGKPWAYYVVALDGPTILEESGFQTFPWAIARYVGETNPQPYGRGPGHIALNAMNTLNEMAKTRLRAGQRALDPPVLLPTDSLARPFSLRSGALNRGMVNAQGQPLAQPFATGARLDWINEAIEQERLVINDAFLITLFRILVDEGRMITATEALLRAQEKGQLLAPTMGRTQAEGFGTMIDRELEMAWEDGDLDDMPEELIESGGLQVEYTAPLNRLMRADDAIAILRSVEVMGPMIQLDPTVQFVMKVPDAYREICEINGVPERLMNSKEEVEELAAADAEAASQEQLLAAAPVAASTLKDIAAARAQAQNVPSPQPLQ